MKMQLTPMQQFAVDLVSKQKKPINPSYLGYVWFYHKNGRYPSAASRNNFGTTTAAYKTLRKLAKMGLITQIIRRSSSRTIEEYSPKN